MAELYQLKFSDGKCYVGATRRTAIRRFADHVSAAKRSKKGLVYHAWRRLGAPTLKVLAIIEQKDMALAESKAVRILRTQHPGGYNEIPGGKIAPSLTSTVANKISQSLTGRTISPEQRRHIGEAVLGRKHSDAAKVNMSRAQTGRTFSDSHLKKLSAAKIGTKHSESTKVKMKISQQNRRKKEAA